MEMYLIILLKSHTRINLPKRKVTKLRGGDCMHADIFNSKVDLV
jgi:hypothetical protein